MIDEDLSHQLHSLAATVNEPVDLAALHRRISLQSRRRAAVKVGFAGAGVAAVVGGLLVVQDRPSPVASSASQVEPAASPDCDVVLAGLRASMSTPDTIVPKDVSTDPSASAGDVSAVGFKGIVTILTIDGPQLTFRVDEPKVASPTTGVGTVDAATVWVDGQTPLDAPPPLQVGEQLGLATTQASDGVDHVIFIDVSAPARVDEKPASAPDRKLTTVGSSADTSIIVPGASLPPGPTAKSMGTIVGVGATSISVTLDASSGQGKTFDIDLAGTAFYAGDTQCVPGSLTVGSAIGVAYHFGDAGNVISDAVMLMP